LEAGFCHCPPVNSGSEFGSPARAANRVFTADVRAAGKHEQRTMSMTALQDWLSFRPVDQSAIKEMVCRPLRAVLSTPDASERTDLKLLQPGLERC
jgi:hypothetical protein